MPRYYLHLRDDVDVPDHEGKNLPDVEAARSYAVELARFELAEMVKREGRIVLRHRIEIEDEAHRVVDTVWFREVVEVES